MTEHNVRVKSSLGAEQPPAVLQEGPLQCDENRSYTVPGTCRISWAMLPGSGFAHGPVCELLTELLPPQRGPDGRGQAEVRQATNTAIDAIDTLLRELHQMRARLVSEVRQADDIAMERSAALLNKD